jgi:hypothetical protein
VAWFEQNSQPTLGIVVKDLLDPLSLVMVKLAFDRGAASRVGLTVTTP